MKWIFICLLAAGASQVLADPASVSDRYTQGDSIHWAKLDRNDNFIALAGAPGSLRLVMQIDGQSRTHALPFTPTHVQFIRRLPHLVDAGSRACR